MNGKVADKGNNREKSPRLKVIFMTILVKCLQEQI